MDGAFGCAIDKRDYVHLLGPYCLVSVLRTSKCSFTGGDPICFLGVLAREPGLGRVARGSLFGLVHFLKLGQVLVDLLYC